MNFKNNTSDPKNLLDAKLRIYNLSSPIKFNNEKEFLERYLPGNNSNAVLPSYMYRTKYLKEVMLNLQVKNLTILFGVIISLSTIIGLIP